MLIGGLTLRDVSDVAVEHQHAPDLKAFRADHLDAADIAYHTSDETTRVVVQRARLTVDWLLMFRGTLLITELELDGVSIEITDSGIEGDRDAAPDDGLGFLPLVLHASVRQLALTYQGAAEPFVMLVEVLDISEPSGNEPLGISGRRR